MGIPTFVAGAMIAQLTAGSAARDALFLSKFSPTDLPYVMGASAILSIAVVSAFSRLLMRLAPDRAMPLAFTCNALLFVAEWLASYSAPDVAAIMTYLHTMAAGGVLVSGFWSLMSERFDPHTAKRVFGRIGAGASIGGVLGGIGAWQAGGVMSIPTLLLLLAGVNIVCAAALMLARRRAGALVASPPRTTTALANLRTPYLRHMAGLVVVAAIADVSVDYVFKATAASQYARGSELITFFALFYTVSGVVSFLLQAFVTRPLLQKLGLTRTLSCHPIALAAGSVIAMLVPGLWPVTFLRGSDGALKTSLFKSGYELLYTPLTAEQKRATKTVIDVGFGRVGGFIGSGIVLLTILVAASIAPSLLLGLAAVAASVSLVIVAILHRGYVNALADGLLRGAIRLDPDDVEDATTLKTLALTTMGINHADLRDQMNALREQYAAGSVQVPAPDDDVVARARDLRSGDGDRIRHALSDDLHPLLVGLAIPLLVRDDLVDDITRSVRRVAPRVTGQLVDALLDPELSILVRRRIPRILVASTTQRSVDGLLLGLAAESYDVRHRVALALERILELEPGLHIDRSVILTAVQLEGQRHGTASDHRLEQIFVLLGLVLERRPLKLAHRALSSTDGGLRGTGIEYLENVLPPEILELLSPHLGARTEPQAKHRAREQIVDELLKSMTAIELSPSELDRNH